MYPVAIANLILRFSGLILYVLLFIQLMVGAFMPILIKKLGKWIFKFHIFEGILIYLLALVHPISFVLSNYFYGSGFNPYVAFINVCLLCNSRLEYYYTIGRVSFWLLTLTVFAAALRKLNPWFVKNWNKFHLLNYLVFLAVGIHGYFLGTYFRVQPFYTFAIVSYALVLGVVLFKELPHLYKNFRDWIRS